MPMSRCSPLVLTGLGVFWRGGSAWDSTRPFSETRWWCSAWAVPGSSQPSSCQRWKLTPPETTKRNISWSCFVLLDAINQINRNLCNPYLLFNKGKDNNAFTKFKDGWIMGTNAMFVPKMFCTNFMFTLGSKIKALERPWIYVALNNRHKILRMHSTIRRNEKAQKRS